MKSRIIRSGYTTGACAASAARGAFEAILCLMAGRFLPSNTLLIFPNGSKHEFTLYSMRCSGRTASVSVIKEAGDDPDVTHGAEIRAEVTLDKTAKNLLRS